MDRAEDLGAIVPRLREKLMADPPEAKEPSASPAGTFCVGDRKLGQECSFCSRQRNFANCGLYRRRWRELLELSQIPPRYWNAADLFTHPPRPLAGAYRQVANFIANLGKALSAGQGLLLKGPPGSSKTTVAAAVAMQVFQLRARSALTNPWTKPAASPVLFVPVAKLLDKLFTLKAVETREWALYEERLLQVPLLILDDLGAEHPEGWVQTKIDSLIAERYNAKKSLIITTNLRSGELLDRYAARIMDRLYESVREINLELTETLRSPPSPP